jgi:uncharacterized protein YciI
MTETAQYLYKIRPSRPAMLTDGPTPAEQESVSEHFEYLRRLTEEGVVILAGRTLNTDETSFGIVIFRAASPEAARALMENDPAVRRGVMLAELYPYRVALLGKNA